jgi:Protein of unknown function (DUF3800)
MAENNNLWIFVDETGTSSLDNHVTPIFGLGFLITNNPQNISQELTRIKYKIWMDTPDKDSIIQYFHATDNPNIVRHTFYHELKNNSNLKFLFNVSYIQKELLYSYYFQSIDGDDQNPNFQEFCKTNWLVNTYLYFIVTKLASTINTIKRNNYKTINLVLSRIFSRKIESTLVREIKKFEILKDIKINIFFADNKTDLCCQVADYFTWSVNRKITKNQDIGYSYLESKGFLELADISEDYISFLVKNNIKKTLEIVNKIAIENSPPIDSSFRRKT